MYLLGDMLSTEKRQYHGLSYNYNKLIKSYLTQFSMEHGQLHLLIYKRPVSTNPGLVTITTLFTFHLQVPVSTYKILLTDLYTFR